MSWRTPSLAHDIDMLLRDRDRLETILNITQAATTVHLEELLEQVGACLQRGHWGWDYTSLSIYEPERNVVRQHYLYSTPGLLPEESKFTGLLIPVEGSQHAEVIRDKRTSVANSHAEYLAMLSEPWASQITKHISPEFSCCIVPLLCRGRLIGTLVCASRRNRAFDADAIRFLQRIAQAVAPALDNALAYRQIDELRDRLSQQKTYLEREIQDGFGEIVGTSAALKTVLSSIKSVAATNSSVLIQGETGTGKELVARAVHELSGRPDATFVKVNCAAIPTGLIESELFGHERGAFSGAVEQKVGRFELAHGGTLFLDEIGEIPLPLQSKLLRVLQEREFERLGGTRTLKVDVRVIAATNRDLGAMVRARTFRDDLFYRLNVFPITIPPLRHRRDDIEPLARHFVARSMRRLQKSITSIPSSTLRALQSYDWPGNVRELENMIERSVILSHGPELVVPPGALETSASPEAPRRPVDDKGVTNEAPCTLADAERRFIVAALDETGWIVGGPTGAAARLGLTRTTLQGRMRKLGIVRPPTGRARYQAP
jgi:formate hydrogenlyase transcriptional activator